MPGSFAQCTASGPGFDSGAMFNECSRFVLACLRFVVSRLTCAISTRTVSVIIARRATAGGSQSSADAKAPTSETKDAGATRDLNGVSIF
jgi:hypothetical protein